MAIGTNEIKFEKKHTTILEFADTRGGEGLSVGSFKVSDIEKLPDMFDAVERMYQLLSHRLIEHVKDSEGNETGTYAITPRGRQAMEDSRKRAKSAVAAKPTEVKPESPRPFTKPVRPAKPAAKPKPAIKPIPKPVSKKPVKKNAHPDDPGE